MEGAQLVLLHASVQSVHCKPDATCRNYLINPLFMPACRGYLHCAVVVLSCLLPSIRRPMLLPQRLGLQRFTHSQQNSHRV
jgi:hypothetical protein